MNIFIFFHRETGQPFHNFISWKDRRADALSERYNSSFLIKVSKLFRYLNAWITKILYNE